ncbi:hypothetical protein IU485_28035 [Nocardia cyriacigeorgica]|uniref:hypothetical protein n=1 Tax=Nocardia cyriacigeorgica TaxID=135487 RepID=UPI00189418AE|nr:hypothetical protein [Nocardia cyriacigeorgica]MBF6085223.1 hypothetical protein [Nocardia cyriacigeorgica]
MIKFPVVMVSPDGVLVNAHNAMDFNNLANSGYRQKMDVKTPAAPVAAPLPGAESAGKPSKPVPSRDSK